MAGAWRLFAALSVALVGTMCLAWCLGGCLPKPAIQSIKTGVTIGTDICQEIAPMTSDPTLVTLACQAAEGVVTVVLPKAQWASIKAHSGDAGPGK